VSNACELEILFLYSTLVIYKILILLQLLCELIALPPKASIKYEVSVGEYARVQHAGPRLPKEPLVAAEHFCKGSNGVLQIAENVFFDHHSGERGLG